MTTKPERGAPDELEKLVDGWIDDVLSLSDTDAILEAREAGADPEAIAREMRQLTTRAAEAAGKARLMQARAAIDAARSEVVVSISSMSLAAKQAIVQEFSSNDSKFRGRMTIAARGGNGASEREIDTVLEDLIRLGLIDAAGKPL